MREKQKKIVKKEKVISKNRRMVRERIQRNADWFMGKRKIKLQGNNLYIHRNLVYFFIRTFLYF